MKRIPKTLQLLGHTITVRIVNKGVWDEISEEHDIEDAVACWFPQSNLILIKRAAKSQMQHAFAHELTHAILDMLNDKLSYNEQWVDNFAGLLAQAMDTAK